MAINKKLIHFQRLSTFKELLAANNILDTSIVFIKDALQIWTHGVYYAFADAPANGSSYVRKDNEWVLSPGEEVYVGTDEPSTDYKLWVDSSSDELKYYNGTEWVTLSGAKEVMETMLLTLSSNQTQPDTNLNGASIVIEYSGNQKTAIWQGNELTFSIPMGLEYTVTVGEVQGYATPATKTFTAVAGATRSVSMIYNKTKLTVNRSSNQSDDLGDSTVTASYGGNSYTKSYSSGVNSVVFDIPTGETVTLTFSAIDTYTTPSQGSVTTADATASYTGTYTQTKVTINRASNQSESLGNSTATVTYSSTSKTINFTSSTNAVVVPIPTGVSVSVSFSAITGYKTATVSSFTTSGTTMSKTGTYLTEILTLNVTSTGGTLSGYTITISNVGSQTTATGTYKIPFGTTYTVTASSVDKYVTPVDNTTYTANQASRTITMLYVYNPAVDLSMIDIYGNNRSAATTANCYVVKEANTYRIPLVYGNAIVNGSTNSAAYTKVSGSYSLDFVNGAGTVINTPFIEKQVAISSAQLSIADTDGIFTDVTVSSNTGVTSISNCGYVEFKVASIPTLGANGVISVKNSSGTIIWNWHIWVWADSLNTVSITNSNSVTYKILPYNLASKWDDTGKTKIKNWFYQWGRSVPLLCPSAYNSSSNHASYGSLSFTITSNSSGAYKLGIASPNVFWTYGNNSNYNWYGSSGSHYNLWDANCTSTGTSDNTTVKTVFDPCPPGFKIPNGNTFTGFSTSNGGSWSNGYTWSGTFFPASGYRILSSGSLDNVGSDGYYWSSAAYSQYDAYHLYFYSGRVGPQNYSYRANGVSVRPVAES